MFILHNYKLSSTQKEKSMIRESSTRKHIMWIIPICILAVAVLPGLAGVAHATTSCSATTCHGGAKVFPANGQTVYYDNSPGISALLKTFQLTDISTGNATADYLPPIFWPQTAKVGPFYSVVNGFNNSEHFISGTLTGCENCHSTESVAHSGASGLPTWNSGPSDTCWGCHSSWSQLSSFSTSPHAGNVLAPYFDQPSASITQQAVTSIHDGYDGGLLFQGNGKPVTMADRIAECSVCHDYLARYPNMFPGGGSTTYAHEVGCGGCHDSHIQASTSFVANSTNPFYTEGKTVSLSAWNTVTIESITGSTVLTTMPAAGRSTVVTPQGTEPLSYLNLKAFRVNAATGAQDWVTAAPAATWARGSFFERPNNAIVWGAAGTFANSQTSGYLSDVFTVGSGATGSLSNVQRGNKLYITGTETKSVTLPSDYTGSGTVTVTANFSNAAFTVLSVNPAGQPANSVQLFTTSSTFNTTTGLNAAPTGAEQMGAVASVTVTYPSSTGKGGINTTTVYLYPTDTTTGASFALTSFTINDSFTNSEALCASCHAAGSYLYTAYSAQEPGTKPGAAGNDTAASVTMNLPVYDQYKNSAHADKFGTYAKLFMDPANRLIGFVEFNAGNTNFAAGSPVQKIVYPFDMSLPGTEAPVTPSTFVGTNINSGDLSYTLSPSSATLYLTAPNNGTLVNINDGEFWYCTRCHQGLGTIDYQTNQLGTSSASVLWGDSTLTCVSCHDIHGNNTTGPLVRVPVNPSFHSDFASATNKTGGINAFMDGNPLPTTGSTPGVATVCLLCHQGEESGLTQYYTLYSSLNPSYTLNNPANPAPAASAVDPLVVGNSSCTGVNTPAGCCTGAGTGTCTNVWTTANASLTSVNGIHNLPEGAVFWGRGGFETPGQLYSNNEAHQAVNCTGCHMDTSVTDATNQSTGHTWNPNVQTCQKCHSEGSTISNACGTDSISTYGTQAISTGSTTFATGSQAVTVPAGLSWLTSGTAVTLASTIDLAVQMSGTVTSYTSSSGALTVNVTSVSAGSSSFCTGAGAPSSCCTGAGAGTCTGIDSFCASTATSATPFSCCGVSGTAPSCANTSAAWFVWTTNCDPWNTIQIPAGDNYAGPTVPLETNPYTFQQIGDVQPATSNGPGTTAYTVNCTAAGAPYSCCTGASAGTCVTGKGLMGQLYQALYNDGIGYTGGRSFTLIKNSACTASGTPMTCCTGSKAGTCAGNTGMSPAQVAAAFNFNMLSNTSHNYIHNYKYVVQLLQDSIVDAGGAVTGVRPAGDRPATAYDTFSWSSLTY